MLPVLMLTLLLPRAGAAQLPGAGGLEQVAAFGDNPDDLRMYSYVPEGMSDEPRPLVLVLHGCQQSAADYQAAGWNALADTHRFYIVYPEQVTLGPNGNPARCFNWAGEYGDPANLIRGQGENLSLSNKVRQMIADHAIDE
ncbi:MAG: esterase, partial [Deltaproteobacteria bacterium]|nr:esterase [Deltaproteobacteria bacterium]